MLRSAILLAPVLSISLAVPAEAQMAPAGAPASSLFGVTVSPLNGQTSQQQSLDESTCYQSVKENTGIDPATAAQTAQQPPPATSSLNTAETEYNQAPASGKQNKKMKKFRRGFVKCMKAKDYSVK